jgi:hypothetical protein
MLHNSWRQPVGNLMAPRISMRPARTPTELFQCRLLQMQEIGDEEDPYPTKAQCVLCDGCFDVDQDTVELAADDEHVRSSLCLNITKAGPKHIIGAWLCFRLAGLFFRLSL